MFNNYQLEVLQVLADKWKIWEKTQVSLFTHEDKLRIDELRSVLGLEPANLGCNACFMDDISVVIEAYETQLLNPENTLVNIAETTAQNGTDGGER